MRKWIDFYECHFPSREAAKIFVEELEKINDPSQLRHRAKIMMHQAQRLISLADDIVTIREGRQSLQLLFMIICAENIAKLFYNFSKEGQSKAHVKKFFYEFISENDRSLLEASFTSLDRKALNYSAIIDHLYSVRCDVAHEGKCWGFHFPDKGHHMLNTDPDLIISIPFDEFRGTVVRGCINAIKRCAES